MFKSIFASGNPSSNGDQQPIHELWRQLLEDSPFLDTGRTRPVGRFAKAELELGALLRHGEFSKVFEVLEFPAEEPMNSSKGESSWSSEDNDDPSNMDVSNMGRSNYSYHHQRRRRASLSHQETTTSRATSPAPDIPARSKSDTLDLNDSSNPNNTRAEREQQERQRICHSTAMFQVKLLEPPRKLGGGSKVVFYQAVVNLLAEIQYTRQLQHRHICRARGVPSDEILSEKTPERLLLLTEMIVETLEDRLNRWRHHHNNPQDGSTTSNSNHLLLKKLKYAKDTAGALCYLHERNIMVLHLAPSNIGFLEDGTLQLFDLGTCREEDANHNTNTMDTSMASQQGIASRRAPPQDSNSLQVYKVQPTPVGCVPRYQAPELVTAQYASRKADVYSYAMILFEMITLCIPFDGMKSGQHLVKVCVEGKRPTLNSRDVPHKQSIEVILHHGWRHHPARRLSMVNIRKAIRNVIVDVSSTKQAEREQREYVRTMDQQQIVNPDKTVAANDKTAIADSAAADQSNSNIAQTGHIQQTHVVAEESVVVTVVEDTTAIAAVTIIQDPPPRRRKPSSKSRSKKGTKQKPSSSSRPKKSIDTSQKSSSSSNPRKSMRSGQRRSISPGDPVAKEPTKQPQGAKTKSVATESARGNSSRSPKPSKHRSRRSRSSQQPSRRGNSAPGLATPDATTEPTTPSRGHRSSSRQRSSSRPKKKKSPKPRQRGASTPRLLKPVEPPLTADPITPRRHQRTASASNKPNGKPSNNVRISPIGSEDGPVDPNLQDLRQKKNANPPPVQSKRERRTSLGGGMRSPSPAKKTPRSLMALVTPKRSLKKAVQMRREACFKNPDF